MGVESTRKDIWPNKIIMAEESEQMMYCRLCKENQIL